MHHDIYPTFVNFFRRKSPCCIQGGYVFSRVCLLVQLLIEKSERLATDVPGGSPLLMSPGQVLPAFPVAFVWGWTLLRSFSAAVVISNIFA